MLKKALEIKATLSAMVDDLYKVQLSLSQVVTVTADFGEEVTKLKTQLTYLRREGVKSFNQVLRQVDSAAARAKVSDNELIVVVQTFYASLSNRIEK
ncbi:hypothetical protein HAX54_020159, partial [Datura stramonium]|nr:hypothetical protein [Datura stramonium]